MTSGDGEWLDFGEGTTAPRQGLRVDEWIREVVDDAVAAGLDDPFDITHGKPKLCEGQALYSFFPRLARGIPCKNGRTLVMESGNRENKFGPDFVLRFSDERPNEVLVIIDVERKTRDQLFLSHDLPINVPMLTLTAHTGKVPYQWSDGSWRKAGKMRYFEAYPDATFFLAVAPDFRVALLVSGRDIIEQTPEWMSAKGPFQEFGTDPQRRRGQILVMRVPRSRAVRAVANTYDIENAVMNIAAVREAVATHAHSVP